ncbi:lipocalin family protein [Arenibacter palladensis]|uniref:lipocalin family protein n=1 Tax=Arenibacter palladensis TaxID=237373 RepID=UPI002FCE73AE
MKGIRIICTTVFTLSLIIGCSKDDDSKSNELLIGTWIAVDGTHNGENWTAADYNIIKFTSNNRAEFIYEGFGNNGEDIHDMADWEKVGNTLTIKWDESDPGLEIFELKILDLTSSRLVWRSEDPNAEEYNIVEIFNKN